MEIHVGNTYKIIDADKDVTICEVLELDSDNDFKCKVIESTYYEKGLTMFYDQKEFDDMEIVELIKDVHIPMEKQNTIKLNTDLRKLFIDLALQTKDEKWFKELTNTPEGSVLYV